MGIRFYNLNGFFVKKLAHGVNCEIIFSCHPRFYETCPYFRPVFRAMREAGPDPGGHSC